MHRIDVPEPRAADPRPASLSRGLATVLDWVLPGPCVACGRNVELLRPPLGLCQRCLHAWPDHRPHRCSICGRDVASTAPPGYRCGACRRRRVPHRRLTVGWAYAGPVTASLRAFKFQRLERLGPQIVDRLVASLTSEENDALSSADIVTAVPLWRWRLLRRGYNQAEVLGRGLASRLGLPYSTLLARRRGSRPQSRLARADRRGNVRGTMRPARSGQASGAVVVVDDVVTTGSTLEEAARTLRRAGADEVHCLAFARTPEP